MWPAVSRGPQLQVGEISDPLGRPVTPAPPVVSHLRPSQARALAFELLALAEHAERRSDSER
jgi:hypothetical protein